MQAGRDERRVVITGRGVITPLGHNPQALLDRWAQGVPAAAPLRRLDATLLPSKIAAEIVDFVPQEHIQSRKLLRMLQRGEDFALAAAAAAFREARLTPAELDPARSGIALGCSKEGPPLENFYPALESSQDASGAIDHARFARAGLPLLPPLTVIQSLPNACLYFLAQLYRLEGVNWNFLSYGAGSALALAESFEALRRGEADLMLAGGFDSWIYWVYLILWPQLGWLSRANDQPQNAHRPFDIHRDGSVAGEGAGFAILEDLEHARTRHAGIQGELRAAFSGLAPAGMLPARVLADGIAQALDEAQWRPEDIDVVHVNGDATPDGDSWEAEALQIALGPHARQVPVTTIKSATGHLGNGAAAVELAALLQMMQQGVLLPILNLTEPDPRMPLQFVRQVVKGVALKRALLLSRGWPAHFASVLLERWDA